MGEADIPWYCAHMKAKGQGGKSPSDTPKETAVKVVKAEKTARGIVGSVERKKRGVALGAVLAPLMEPALARQGMILAQIAPHWRAICPMLAAHSCPESVRNDVLTVAVASDGVKQELQYMVPQVVESVNRLLGYEAVSKVRMVTRHDVGKTKDMPVKKSVTKVDAGARDKAEGLCKSVRDDELRAALGRLGTTIMTKKT